MVQEPLYCETATAAAAAWCKRRCTARRLLRRRRRGARGVVLLPVFILQPSAKECIRWFRLKLWHHVAGPSDSEKVEPILLVTSDVATHCHKPRVEECSALYNQVG